MLRPPDAHAQVRSDWAIAVVVSSDDRHDHARNETHSTIVGG